MAGSGSLRITNSTSRRLATHVRIGCPHNCKPPALFRAFFKSHSILCSYLRVMVLLMTIIPSPYWRLFSCYLIIFVYLVAELLFKPWRLRSVQIFSYVSYFLLLFAMCILFRPASECCLFLNQFLACIEFMFVLLTYLILFANCSF